MKRFLKHVRRPARWPEETHVMIAGAITITLIFCLVIGAAKIWPSSAVPAAIEGVRK